MNFTNQKIGKKKKKNLLIPFLIGLAIGIGGYFGFKEYQYRYLINLPASEDSRVFPFDIQEGELPQKVSMNLQENGFVISAEAFLKYSKRSELGNKYQAGRFYLAKNLTIPEVAEKLTQAEVAKITVVFPEGFTVQEMDARLARLGLIQENEFKNCVFETCNFSEYDFLPTERDKLEGFFFPDTYFVYPQSFELENFAKQMIDNFQNRTQKFWPDIEKNGRNLTDTIIMASILEKETRTGTERPMVADIFWRRLDNGISLGADATVRFFTGNKEGDITYEDLQEDNPYNTRKHRGLTPTAICNPGLESIKATIYPKSNAYWYFLHDNSGEIHYAESLLEHNANKRKYLN